jgi:hypothetical protein
MLKEKKGVAMRKGLILFLLQFFFVGGFGQVTLTGLVTNSRGESLPGASVVLDGTYQGVTPINRDGTFFVI